MWIRFLVRGYGHVVSEVSVCLSAQKKYLTWKIGFDTQYTCIAGPVRVVVGPALNTVM